MNLDELNRAKLLAHIAGSLRMFTFVCLAFVVVLAMHWAGI